MALRYANWIKFRLESLDHSFARVAFVFSAIFWLYYTEESHNWIITEPTLQTGHSFKSLRKVSRKSGVVLAVIKLEDCVLQSFLSFLLFLFSVWLYTRNSTFKLDMCMDNTINNIPQIIIQLIRKPARDIATLVIVLTYYLSILHWVYLIIKYEILKKAHIDDEPFTFILHVI